MKQQHGKYDVKKYHKGINSDVSKELINEEHDGVHVDALNMRSLSQDGTNLGKTHIGGESNFYPANDTRHFSNQSSPSVINFVNYRCVMTQFINDKIVEIWCSTNNTTTSPSTSEPSFIRINGDICLMSTDFPVYHDKPLQYDKNQHVLGSEFYITDFHSEPMIFNVQDLIDSYATAKYFASFNLSQYTITVEANLYKPQFINLTSSTPSGASVIGTTGLPVGQYSYSYRYVTESGDYSSFSPLTDIIPVVLNINRPSASNIYLDTKCYSGHPNVTVFSSYNPHIKLRFVNNNNFASIQIVRHAWQTGATLDTQPISYIIHTHDISSVDGMGVFEFVDKQYTLSAMTSITYSESNNDVTSIAAAKSIRFYNKRLYLMNLKYKSKDTADELNLTGTDYIFPTIQKLYSEGHGNVYNATMYKSYMRGERQGYGVLLYDNNGSAAYVTPIPTGNPNDSYHHPNRRKQISNDTKGVSYEGVVTAIHEDDKNGTPDLTHEVFDHERAMFKPGSMNYDVTGSPGEAVIHPTTQNDSESDYLYSPNNLVGDTIDSLQKYQPQCFELDYYSLGVAVKNIKIPPGFSGFSIVKTEPAKRVIAQGVAMYGFSSAKTCSVYFPDLYKLDTTILDNLLSTGGAGYKLEIVSALGFFTEVYSGYPKEMQTLFGLGQDYSEYGIDMITYSRILRENGNINPTANGYVKYNSWINTSTADVTTSQILDITSVTAENGGDVKGNAQYLNITLDSVIYHTQTDLHGTTPMYIVNLIRDNDISDATIVEYTSTGHFQKQKSLIGKITTQTNQSFPLISERWEDCINQPFGAANNDYNAYSALEKYIYIEDELGQSKPWLNVTYKSTPQINVILDAITNYGFYQSSPSNKAVYGVYKDNSPLITLSESTQRDYLITFDHFNTSYSIDLFIPKTNKLVYVMYDDRIPVRVFGGDTFVNECVWAYKDWQYSSDGVANGTGDFILDRKFPYNIYSQEQMQINIAISTNGGTSTEFVSEAPFLLNAPSVKPGKNTHIRQLINMFTAETRSPLCFTFEDDVTVLNSLSKSFPLKHYVPRPYKWDTTNPTDNVNASYFTAYGNEQDYWHYGGFKFAQTINQDYANRNNAKLLTSVPKLGFKEQTNYPTRIAWSEKKAVNQQNTPSTKTFLASNKFDLSDNNGEIKFAWSATSENKGSNLYAVTSNGIALILVDKRIINDANAQELFSGSAVDEGVVDGLWITQTIGMYDEYWRSWAEYNNVLFFFNNTGVYALTSNQVEYLSEQGGFQEIFKNRVIPYIGKGFETKMAGVFNILTKEYIMTFDENNFPESGYTELIPNSLIYGVTQQALQCRASYNHDKYLSVGNKLYGMRDGITFELGQGNIVDGKVMTASVTGSSSGKKGRFEPDILYQSKEFIRIRVNSNHKPKKIIFFNNYEDYLNGVSSSEVDSSALSYSIKDYGGYECYIPRARLAPHLRQQGRLVLFRIENDTNEDFSLNATMVQFKVLK